MAELKFLSADDVSRIRPTVNVDALERMLEAAPASARRSYILACFRSVTDAELQSLGITLPPPQKVDASGMVTIIDGQVKPVLGIHPARQSSLRIKEVADPKLAGLWREVEPQVAGGA